MILYMILLDEVTNEMRNDDELEENERGNNGRKEMTIIILSDNFYYSIGNC